MKSSRTREAEQLVPDEDADQTLSDQLMEFSDLSRTVDGSGFAYQGATCVDKRIGIIKAIEGYQHLQTLNFAQNRIKDIAPLKGLQFMLKLDLSQNSIPNLKGWESEEPVFPNLVHLNLNKNQLTALPPLAPFKALRVASFQGNEIASCQEFGGHEKLQVLDLSENKLTSLAGVSALPELTKLDVSGNELTEVTGLADVPLLAELRLARNRLEALQGPWQDLASLQDLDLRGNLLATAKSLEVLRALPKLRSLDVQENPFAEDHRVQVLNCHWRLKLIDAQPVTEQELELAREQNVRNLTEERERAKAEAAAAEAAAE